MSYTPTAATPLEELKAKQHQIWTSGDYGKVAWITPPGTTGRQQGIGIQFSKTDASMQARAKIEDLLGSTLKSSRPSNTV